MGLAVGRKGVLRDRTVRVKGQGCQDLELAKEDYDLRLNGKHIGFNLHTRCQNSGKYGLRGGCIAIIFVSCASIKT